MLYILPLLVFASSLLLAAPGRRPGPPSKQAPKLTPRKSSAKPPTRKKNGLLLRRKNLSPLALHKRPIKSPTISPLIGLPRAIKKEMVSAIIRDIVLSTSLLRPQKDGGKFFLSST